LLDSLKKTDFRNHIVHAIENSHVKYRSFDPTQVPRLTAAQAISEISSSSGAIVTILNGEIVDAEIHNYRASFILGLCHGFGIDPLAMQYENNPAPLDYRDFITNSTFRRETESHVAKYCAETLVWNQRATVRGNPALSGVLNEIDLGSPTAENESQKLGYYFVETAEYARTLRAEGVIVIGRKGSGKSAIYLQLCEKLAKSKKNCIVDLRPASHNLSEMREAILTIVKAGVFDHTIYAFWQYIVYVEILLKIREMALLPSRNSFPVQERIRAIESEFSLSEEVVSGDFTSRLDTAVKHVIGVSRRVSTASDLRSELTNFMFEKPIHRLREAVISFSDFYEHITVLIDDLDMGWPPKRVEAHDVGTVKHLIEVLNRIQRDLGKRKVDFKHMMFLRSDIYERLVEQTSDRGKYNLIKVDWSDPEQLRHLLKRRVISNFPETKQNAAWEAINPGIAPGRDSVELMIDNSLRRPRILIDLCERALSCAINRGHDNVSIPDVEEALRQMSLYLVSDFGYEMRDVAGTPEYIFYAFIGAKSLLTEAEIAEIIAPISIDLGIHDVIELLLWYGFLGICEAASKPIFIYDRAYDFRRLEAEGAGIKGELLYAVNPAFLMGLERR